MYPHTVSQAMLQSNQLLLVGTICACAAFLFILLRAAAIGAAMRQSSSNLHEQSASNGCLDSAMVPLRLYILLLYKARVHLHMSQVTHELAICAQQ